AILVTFPKEMGQKTKHLLLVNSVKDQQNPNTIHIRLPLLFGEWMPMNEEGILYKNRLISFTSDKFLRDAIYVRDFTKWIIQVLNSTQVPSFIYVKSSRSKKRNIMLDNIIFLHDNRPITKKLKHVKANYHLFKK